VKIAITNPTNWPYLRRGFERFINEGAVYWARRGHEVTIVCGKPGKSETVVRNGYTTRYYRRLWNPWFLRVGFLEFHAFFFPALFDLLTHKYDVILCGTFMDALAAEIARFFTGTPYIFGAFAVPPKVRYFRSLTLKGAIYKRAVVHANRFIGISNYVLDYFEARWGVRGMRLPVPINTDYHSLREQSPSGPPVILCSMAIDDARKGGFVLMSSFNIVKRRWPDAILQTTWTVRSESERSLVELVRPEWRKDLQFLGTDVELPPLFRSATVCVLPSLWEAQGMVVLEALACGTPVVVTRDGALPEFHTDPRVSRLFDPGTASLVEPSNTEGLAQALLDCIDLSYKPETRLLCRQYAEQFGWEQMGPKWEELLQSTAGAETAQPQPAACAP